MQSLKSKKIVILGAGIAGLSTAMRLYEQFDGGELDLTIIGEKFQTETTSDGAGGLFRPDDRFMPGVSKQLAKKWVKDSFEYYDRFLWGPEGGKAGVAQSSGYQLFNDQRHDPSYKEVVYQFRNLNQIELESFPQKFRYGYFCTTIVVDARFFMKYLTDILVQKGVKFEHKKLSTLRDFIENSSYDVVFNCLGLGNIEFCGDKKLVPIRGQMIRVNAPWIKHFYYTDDNCYIIPNMNTVCLGGTRQVGNFSLDLDRNDSTGILERCKKMCPSLENCKIEWEWVGLRPHREPTRVEKEILNGRFKNDIIVIHNYGHGGNGISLSPGTAKNAVDLLQEELQTSSHILKSKI